jgi:TonB family protein
MNRLFATLTGFIFIAAFSSTGSSQELKPKPNSTASKETKKDQHKGEVDLALDELKKRNEGVLSVVATQFPDSDKITSGVLNVRAIELVQPSYPATARAAHASGEVAVLVLIDKDGKVMAAQIVDGDPLLQGASIRAAKASRFTPTRLGGKPINVLGQIIYNFPAVR